MKSLKYSEQNCLEVEDKLYAKVKLATEHCKSGYYS